MVRFTFLPFLLVSLCCFSDGYAWHLSHQSAGTGQAGTGSVSLSIQGKPKEVKSVVVTLSRNGFRKRSFRLKVSDASLSATGTVGNISVGSWNLQVDALDVNGVRQYTGETKVNVRAGEMTPAGVDLLPLIGSVEVRATWGKSSLERGLILYLPFDGDLRDASGSGNDGMATGAEFTRDAWGNPNGAYLFNGSSNYISVPDNTTLNPSRQLTMTTWVRIDSVLGNYTYLVSKAGPVRGYYSNREYYLEAKEGSSTAWYPNWKSAGSDAGMRELDGGNCWFGTHEWVFLAFVVDRIDHKMKSYKNGRLWNEVNDPDSSFNVNTYPLAIGWSPENQGTHRLLKGAMDNFRIYNRALTECEIENLFENHL